MILYNVTVKIAPDVAADWLRWLKEIHIPEMKATGCFYDAVIFHLLDSDESEGITYAVQYHAENKEAYNRYLEHFADSMRKKGVELWGNRFAAFRTLLELVH